MANSWQSCKNILCIRPDNMGDLIMTGPALRALKESFGAKITVLTSSMAAGIARFMPDIDEVIICDLPWVKTQMVSGKEIFKETIEQIKDRQFDAAVIFTVYSQNPLPTVMLAYLAGIPKTLAYCRENPYQLLTHWVPDIEPYSTIKHQVQRDLDLVATIGAYTINDELFLNEDEKAVTDIRDKLKQNRIDPDKKWLILHPGVSEIKREYPVDRWVSAGQKLINTGYQLLITGSASEKNLTEMIQQGIGEGSYALGGVFNLNEFITLIKMAPLIVSVNTGTIHIAAAVKTPVVVLYALTNPQHTPWMVQCKILPFQIPADTHSKNEVIRYVNGTYYQDAVPIPDENDIYKAITDLLSGLNSLPNRAIYPSRGYTPIENQAVQAS